jgi:predicted O-linked N-acetylglucosamine transferase (SPINDLY family)
MYAAAYRNLGDAYQAQGSIAEAIASYRDALRLTGRDELKIRCALALPVILESQEQVEEVRGRLARELESLAGETLRVNDPVHGIGALAFALAYHGRNEREFQSRIAGIVRSATPELAYVAPHCTASAGRPRGRRIRVGFISMHFRDHTIGKLNAGLIERFDRDAFRVAVFRGAGADDATSRRIADSADECVTLAPQLATAQSQIAQHELDVLFYTDVGIDPVTCFLAHARLAPVQCVTWGHPLTTGVPTIDYFISSVDLEPPDSAAHYTEKLVRLPHLANYYFRPQPSPSTKTRRDFGLSDEAHGAGRRCPASSPVRRGPRVRLPAKLVQIPSG